MRFDWFNCCEIDILRKKKICYQKIKRFCREVKRLPTSLIRIFLPEKEDRLRIRISLQRFKAHFTKIFTRLAS
jgi:hypothetical protein